ncbi:S1 RNA-binding domain-containing protein [Streptomyces huiliensis]|uniref:S1 RNA-binding domain-containing protein n=1 Tax=Streptomyces huiliensis TaxID=2876027 RepID=UPI001CBD62B5|nr:S1 RNA-binding domain-containing protein [Streptomyces huiliensis]
MTEADPFHHLRTMLNRPEPGPVRRVKVVGFDGPDVLVSLADGEGPHAETGRIPGGEVSMRRAEHPSAFLESGQEVEAEEIGRFREGELLLSASACEYPQLRSFLVGIRPGQVVSGTVSAVHDFGVFVDLDGQPDGFHTGFIRVPDLSWSWSDRPSDVVRPGQRITARVIQSETRRGQVAVSLKALQENPAPVSPIRSAGSSERPPR